MRSCRHQKLIAVTFDVITGKRKTFVGSIPMTTIAERVRYTNKGSADGKMHEMRHSKVVVVEGCCAANFSLSLSVCLLLFLPLSVSRSLARSLAPSLSLSLFHTHTHTHKHGWWFCEAMVEGMQIKMATGSTIFLGFLTQVTFQNGIERMPLLNRMKRKT